MTTALHPNPTGTPAPGVPVSPVTAEQLLTQITDSREAARHAEVQTMLACLAWARMHPATSLEGDAAALPGTDRALAIAGEGAPLVSDFAVVELATVLHRSADSARLWLGQVMETRYRLPATWEAVVAGPLEPWRALMIARQTQVLSPAAAAWVDAQVAERAHKVGPRVLERLVTEAAERFDPDETYEEATTGADHRRVNVETRVHHGLVNVDAVLDAADARDLDAALAKVAAEMLATGAGAGAGTAGRLVSPQVRRALALGELARRELATTRDHTGDHTGEDAGRSGRRDSTLYVHIDADALDQAPGEPSWARIENGSSSYTITLDRLREWLSVNGTHITLRPVIDLPATASVNGYEATERLREHVILRRPVCAFPFCSLPARRADLDHITPYDPDPPPGEISQTNTENLAPCCRRHHRAKTHAGWTYHQLSPGEYLWHGPNHQRFHVDHTGTTAL